ncbi:protein transport protein Sec24B [Lepeophtheirus salmonis]|uniref:protein transport protein Sec24B n=1 Tax=Lepeophtheirus salmonis TaxID=72036 RepID=UPI001AE1F067|nr:protein transport protein Sec24B-like [Lepeophtheirus salmonis]
MTPVVLPEMRNMSLSCNLYEPQDLLQNRGILPSSIPPAPRPPLQISSWNEKNCSPDVFRCTLRKIPQTESLLKKSRLPLGLSLHPFKDLNYLTVIQCPTIVRCRQCRTYINPFVQFIDQRRWKCNICFRINEVPEEFLYDPSTKSYGDPSRRPECNSSTIEFIAPSEYMLRPPQPAVYVFCLDVSRQAWESGYIRVFCNILMEELDKLPGDRRTQVGFITYSKSVQFYSLTVGSSKPIQMTVSDIDDMFVPTPNDLVVNLKENKSLIKKLLSELPDMFENTSDTESAFGAALQACYKLLYPTGGRVTVLQCMIPSVGPGTLFRREKSEKNASALFGPAIDFYKKLALDFSGQQIAVDLFTLGNNYVDLATVEGISKFSGGQLMHFPGYHVNRNIHIARKFESYLRRYLTRKIGFEAVMRVRCTRGLALTAFHGNFFVRSTDLLSLPNINPDAGFGMQLVIEDDLHDCREVSFQAALLYTSSKGERRIRVHTLCVPTTTSVMDIINYADQEAIIGMLAKFATDRAVNGSIEEAKEGLIVSCTDALETYHLYSSISNRNGLPISNSLKLLPLYILALLKSDALKNDVPPDYRTYCFSQLKTLPLSQVTLMIYPSLYRVDNLLDVSPIQNNGECLQNMPPRLQLSYENIQSTGMYLMDCGDVYLLYLTRDIPEYTLENFFGKKQLNEIDGNSYTELPELNNPESERLKLFLNWLESFKTVYGTIKIIREDSDEKWLFIERLIEDKCGNNFSYFEFLHHLKRQLK